MKHLRIIIEREYLNKIRNKSFIIMTFVSPLIVVAFALIIGFLTNVNSKSNAKDILILDESGLFSNTFSDTETIHYEYLKDKTLQEARAEVLETSKYGLLYIPKEETAQKAFYSEESPSLSLVNELTGALEKTLFQYNLTQKGLIRQK